MIRACERTFETARTSAESAHEVIRAPKRNPRNILKTIGRWPAPSSGRSQAYMKRVKSVPGMQVKRPTADIKPWFFRLSPRSTGRSQRCDKSPSRHRARLVAHSEVIAMLCVLHEIAEEVVFPNCTAGGMRPSGPIPPWRGWTSASTGRILLLSSTRSPGGSSTPRLLR